MASEECTKVTSIENFEWNVENEIKLFEAMIGLKPTGINKHFEMACICEKFETSIGKSVSPEILWHHLGTMYDLPALEKKETIPFLHIQEEFSLPEAEYSDLMKEKCLLKTEIVNEPKESKDIKSTQKIAKDSAPAKSDVVIKKEKPDTDDVVTNIETDKKDIVESESENKKGKPGKEIKTRGKRSLKDKKGDEDNATISVSTTKKEETNSSNSNSTKKEKQPVGKRTLRSRADDSLPNKSLTPPPAKRSRRI